MSENAPETNLALQAIKPRRSWLRAIFLLVLSLTVIGAGLPILYLGMTGAPVSAPSWLSARVEQTVNARLATGRVSFNDIEVSVDPTMRPEVQMRDVGVFDQTGAEIARLNQINAVLSRSDLMRGAVGMNALTVSGAQMVVRRRTDGSFALSFGQGGGAQGDVTAVVRALEMAFASEPLAGLSTIRGEDLTISLEDARSGRVWQVTGGSLIVRHAPDNLDFTVSAEVFNGTEDLASVIMGFRVVRATGQAELTAQFENAAAADIAAQSPVLSFLSVLDAPISGSLRTVFSPEGQIEDLAGTLSLAQGVLQPDPGTPPIRFDLAQAYVDYDPQAQSLSFSELSFQSETASVTARGTAYLQDFQNRWPQSLVGQFELSDVSLQPKGVFAQPMEFRRGNVDFRLRLDPFSIEIGQFTLLDQAAKFLGNGRLRADAEGWNVALDLDLNTLSLDRLLELWPVDIAKGARRWLGENIFAGDVSNLVGAFRFQTDTAPVVSASFQFRDAEIRGLKFLPNIQVATGYASIIDKGLTLVLETGTVQAPQGGRVSVEGSVFHIGDLSGQPAQAALTLNTESALAAGLSLLDLPPLEYISNAGQPVDVAQGRAVMQTRFDFPLIRGLRFENVRFTSVGTLRNVVSDSLVPGHPLTAETLDVRVDNDGIEISGAARLGILPVTASWVQKFGPEASGSRIEGTAELSQRFLDQFGIALPPGSLNGAGVAQVSVDIARDAPPKVTVQSDLNRVAMRLDALGWSKPRNRTGQLEVVARLGPQPAIDRLVLNAPGLRASGVVDLSDSGGLERAQFDRVQVGQWFDGPVTLIGRGSRPPAVSIQGGAIDMRRAEFGSGGAGSEGGPLDLRLDRLTISEGISLRNFRGQFREGRGLNGQFSGLVNGTAPVSGSVVSTPSGAAIQLVSDEAGAVLSAAGILRNARGGRMDLSLNPTRREGVYDGKLQIRNTRIVQAPALTELLSAISIVGLLDQMNSGGITLSEVEAEFSLSPNNLVLYYSSAVGPSLGISLDGIFDMKNSQLNMQGVVSPVYFLNGIGQIFSRGRDGLFGFNFTLTGKADDPRVSVNPLSILTPGAFREIFRRPPPTPSE